MVIGLGLYGRAGWRFAFTMGAMAAVIVVFGPLIAVGYLHAPADSFPTLMVAANAIFWVWFLAVVAKRRPR